MKTRYLIDRKSSMAARAAKLKFSGIENFFLFFISHLFTLLTNGSNLK